MKNILKLASFIAQARGARKHKARLEITQTHLEDALRFKATK